MLAYSGLGHIFPHVAQCSFWIGTLFSHLWLSVHWIGTLFPTCCPLRIGTLFSHMWLSFWIGTFFSHVWCPCSNIMLLLWLHKLDIYMILAIYHFAAAPN